MAELIITTPSPPYVGEIYANGPITGELISALANPTPLGATFEVADQAGQADRPAPDLVGPVLLPVENAEDQDCLFTCVFGFPSRFLGGTGIASVSSGLVPKSWVGLPQATMGASRFTSPFSILAHKVPSLGAIRVPRPIPPFAPTGFPIPKLTRQIGLLRFLGRWIPGIGWALLASDLVAIDQCVADCTGHRSFLRALCEETFCSKPAR